MNQIAMASVGDGGGGGLPGGSITNPALGTLSNLTGEGFFQRALPAFVGVAFVIGVLIFMFQLVVGAIQWIMSGGDKANLENARTKITNAIVGIIILFAAFAVIKVIEAFFHISILALDIGSLKIQ